MPHTGSDPVSPGPGQGGAPPPANVSSDSQIRQSISRFTDQLGETNPQFFDIGQGLIDRGLGTATDPLIEAQRQRGLDASRAQLVRSGVTGGAFSNQQARVSGGFDQSALARRDTALQGGLQLQQSALQNLLAEPTLDISALAASKSGQGSGGGKK